MRGVRKSLTFILGMLFIAHAAVGFFGVSDDASALLKFLREPPRLFYLLILSVGFLLVVDVLCPRWLRGILGIDEPGAVEHDASRLREKIGELTRERDVALGEVKRIRDDPPARRAAKELRRTLSALRDETRARLGLPEEETRGDYRSVLDLYDRAVEAIRAVAPGRVGQMEYEASRSPDKERSFRVGEVEEAAKVRPARAGGARMLNHYLGNCLEHWHDQVTEDWF